MLSKKLAVEGFPLLYSVMLEISAEKICHVLSVILVSLESGSPVVFHCAQGKDRTGIIAMLIEAIVESERSPNIIPNYAASEKFLPEWEAKRDILEAGVQKGDFVSTLRGSPAEGMEGTLAYVRSQWGSVEAYLDHAGFDGKRRRRLRAVFGKL